MGHQHLHLPLLVDDAQFPTGPEFGCWAAMAAAGVTQLGHSLVTLFQNAKHHSHDGDGDGDNDDDKG